MAILNLKNLTEMEIVVENLYLSAKIYKENQLNFYWNSNIILMGDFNAELADAVVSNFFEIHNPKNILTEKAYLNSNNPSSIDLILTNRLVYLLWQVYLTFTKCVLW